MARVWVAWARDDQKDVAERMVRALVGMRYGPVARGARTGRVCPRCASTGHGGPRLHGFEGPGTPGVSIARAPGATVVALASCGALGVDVERTDLVDTTGVADVVLHPAERAPTAGAVAAAWVRKEALLKACGQGLVVDPSTVRLDDSTGSPVVVEWPAPFPRPDWVIDVSLAPDLTAAVAGRGGDRHPGEVTVLEAGPGGSLG